MISSSKTAMVKTVGFAATITNRVPVSLRFDLYDIDTIYIGSANFDIYGRSAIPRTFNCSDNGIVGKQDYNKAAFVIAHMTPR